jgi:hypothetical protein
MRWWTDCANGSVGNRGSTDRAYATCSHADACTDPDTVAIADACACSDTHTVRSGPRR